MARSKELRNSQKALIVKPLERWKSNLNIPFTMISSSIARFKRHNTVENKKEQVFQGRFLLDYQKN